MDHEISFRDIDFIKKGDILRCIFYDHFYFDIKKLPFVDNFYCKKGILHVESEGISRFERKFMHLIEDGIRNRLKSIKDDKKTIYIDSQSGIPLIGSVAFGIVDRNTNLIEIKPITGCNMKCIYCSVDEDKRLVDYVVEPEYMVSEVKKLIKEKDCNEIDIHIGGQGEPLRYKHLSLMINGISQSKQVKNISIDTNGILLTKKLADDLIGSGLTQVNLSVNAFDNKLCKKIADSKAYDLENIKKIAAYLSGRIKLVIAPVVMKDINVDDMEKIALFCKEIGAGCGIQNYLPYSGGRNPAKQIEWNDFFDMLRKLEKKSGIKLVLSEKDFNIFKTKELKKPFKKGDKIKVLALAPGQFRNEHIGSAKSRTVTFTGNIKNYDSLCNVLITRDKHNIFVGQKNSKN